MKPVFYSDLVLFYYEPCRPQEVAMLFRNKPHSVVQEIFRPDEIFVGCRMSVKHGIQKWTNSFVPDISWGLMRKKTQASIEFEGSSYQLILFEARFWRDGLPTIPHKQHDRFVMAPYRDLWELQTEFGELVWGYASEREITGALQEVKKQEQNLEYA